MSSRAVLRSGGRWLAGLVLVGAIAVAGIVVRGYQVGAAQDAGPADAIVVLGAAQYDGRPSPVFRARLDHAAALLAAGVAPRIVTLGGGLPGDRTTEGAAGKAYLESTGIPAAALTSVPVGNDTLESLRAAAGVLADAGWHRVVLVTDPAHALRAQLMATDLGIAAGTASVTQGPAVNPAVQLRYRVRETLGTVFYLVVGGPSGAGSPVL